jgi:hypothetical protein
MISLPRGDDAVLGKTESRLSDRKLKSPFKPALAWSAVGVILGWLEAHEGQAAYASIQNISGLPQGLAGHLEAG